VQAVPETQSTQLPARQTRFVPHEVPSKALPLSAQTGDPVEQEIAAVWQGSEEKQLAPEVHATQAPFEQTLFAPQEVPLAWLSEVTHTGSPVAQETFPTLQGLAEVQLAPEVHDTQAPFEQVWFAPQEVPLAWLSESTHTGRPVAQETFPTLQALLEVQLSPSWHAPASGLWEQSPQGPN
jgi:hypothetical protein